MPPLPSGPAAALVGRDETLAGIERTLGIGGDSEPTARVVVLAGDAGVGKTRLLTELRDRCFAAGWDVLAGHCLDFDGGLPYLPFTEIIGRLADRRPELVDAVLAEHPTLNRLRAGRRLLFEPGEVEPGAERDAVDRAALYAGVHALLAAAAAEQPLLVVVEDAHWADTSTRDLLSFLFARPLPGRSAIVVSYRSDDLHRRHPLRRTVAEWTRVPGVARLQLAPLTADDVRRLVALLEVGDGPVTGLPEPAVSRIVERAEGNAFFVEELVGAAGATGATDTVPENLADLLLVRLERLSSVAQQVVRTAAVAGRRVRHPLLAAASHLSSEAIDAGLREAVEQHVLLPDRTDAFAFRHALLGEAVYDDLLPGERTRLHAAYADALQEGRAPGTAAELARHARLAQQRDTAIGASVQAGDEAMSVAGPVEAAAHYEVALSLLGDGDPPEGVDLASLGHRAVDALVDAGDPPRALALAESLLEELPAGAPPEQRAELRYAAAGTVFVAETRRSALDFTGPGLAELSEQPSLLRARLLHLHARALSYDDALAHGHTTDESRAVAVEALGLAESLGAPRLASDVLATLAGFDRESDAPPERIEASLRDAARAAAAAGAQSAELRARWLLGRWHFDRAELEASRTAFLDTWEHAERMGAHWAPYGFDARFALLQLAYLTGEWDRAVGLADVSGQAPPLLPEAILAAGLLSVRAGRGDLDALTEVARLRERWDDDGIIAVTAGPAAIELYGLDGDVDGVVRHHDELVETLGRLWQHRFRGRVRLAAITLDALSHGLAAVSRTERTERTELADRVHAGAERTVDLLREAGETWGPEGVAWTARLEAERLRFDWLAGLRPPDESELVEARRADLLAFEAMGHVFESARSRARLAAVLHATGDTASAADLVRATRPVAERLGAAPLLAELDALAPARESARAAGREALTPREREILALVAAGRSNGEIGQQLFIATKTVSVHVSRILAKLDAGSRTEAAAIARRDGLLED